MDENSAASKHFFKVMLPGFHEKLDIPPAFCERLRNEKCKWATLSSIKGVWEIGVSKSDEGQMCFTEGWSDFVLNNDLSVGDFVVFQHKGGMHFNTFIFDHTNCEKEFLVQPRERVNCTGDNPKTTKSIIEERMQKSDEVLDKNDTTSNFIITMLPSHERWRRVTIPAEFVRSNNLKQNMRNVVLRDPSGKTWPVRLYFQKNGRNSQTQCLMRKGWNDFYISNKLKIGDTCMFELIHFNSSRRPESVVLDVKISRV